MIHDSDFQTSAEKFKGNILKKKSFFNEIRKDEIIINPYGQGDVSTQVIGVLKKLDFDPCKKFYDLK